MGPSDANCDGDLDGWGTVSQQAACTLYSLIMKEINIYMKKYVNISVLGTGWKGMDSPIKVRQKRRERAVRCRPYPGVWRYKHP